ncbi:hypothetical protein SteCoe_21808 [Stentor coeruleus]|uniref:Uncharacterized protein n=1 Tax=Stentor coeruleus TaxID=5963 RepID=A0A1R2BNN9_9CILI|nr:hypothetical protein SteCoe_21808 [Stentor coeruleus]
MKYYNPDSGVKHKKISPYHRYLNLFEFYGRRAKTSTKTFSSDFKRVFLRKIPEIIAKYDDFFKDISSICGKKLVYWSDVSHKRAQKFRELLNIFPNIVIKIKNFLKSFKDLMMVFEVSFNIKYIDKESERTINAINLLDLYLPIPPNLDEDNIDPAEVFIDFGHDKIDNPQKFEERKKIKTLFKKWRITKPLLVKVNS